MSGGGGSALVLVHGWNPDVGDGWDLYSQQGLACTGGFPVVCDPDPTGTAALPGSEYFTDLLAVLKPAFPDVDILTFTYASYDSFTVSGAQLGAALEGAGYSSYVIVGHSMGGLVAREAVRYLAGRNLQGRVRGVVTLGTPHDGTPGPTHGFLGFFVGPGVRRSGGKSLIAGLKGVSEEGAMTVYRGGFTFSCTRTGNGAIKSILLDAASVCPGSPGGGPLNTNYYSGGALLCALDGECANDGAVPNASARGEGSLSSSVTRRDFDGYDHSQTHTGLAAVSGDPLHVELVTDIRAFLGSSGGGPGTLRYSDDFAGGLGNWVEHDVNGLGSWTTQNNELIGDYGIGCGSPTCHQTQLILADALQPANNGYSNWRMEIQSGQVQAYCCFGGGSIVNLGKFALLVSDSEKEALDVGNAWNFGLPAAGHDDRGLRRASGVSLVPGWFSDRHGSGVEPGPVADGDHRKSRESVFGLLQGQQRHQRQWDPDLHDDEDLQRASQGGFQHLRQGATGQLQALPAALIRCRQVVRRVRTHRCGPCGASGPFCHPG
ncbi:MAG: alpha/beta hydrolase [Gemmatimonadetes bacterium]|nr:alpha/beta hydrolase [Gemmatimonadota bacterium]